MFHSCVSISGSNSGARAPHSSDRMFLWVGTNAADGKNSHRYSADLFSCFYFKWRHHTHIHTQNLTQRWTCETFINGHCNNSLYMNWWNNSSSSVLTFHRSIYQKFRECDVLDKRKTVTALRAGEDRAILLGLSMILCSVMMYFVLGITLLRPYSER